METNNVQKKTSPKQITADRKRWRGEKPLGGFPKFHLLWWVTSSPVICICLYLYMYCTTSDQGYEWVDSH